MRALRCCVAMLMLLCMCLENAGCSQRDQILEQKKIEDQPVQIGLSIDSFVIERWLRDRDAFVMTAKKLGAEVNVQTANGDVEEQISQIGYFIKKKMDVIVVIAADGEAITPVIKEAKHEGIKVICYDRLIHNAGADLYISFDNEAVGRDMGSALMKGIPDGGDIYMIEGPVTDNNVSMIEEGFLHQIEDSKLNVVYQASCEKWNAAIAGNEAENALKEFPDVKGIMCGNDDLATEVVRVLSEKRLAGKVCIVGQDADLAACQRIVEGTQNMTVFKQVEALANAAAYCAVALAKGEDIIQKDLPSENLFNGVEIAKETISDGTYIVPYFKLDCIPVTNENMDLIIIDSGFHTRDDVYLNVK